MGADSRSESHDEIPLKARGHRQTSDTVRNKSNIGRARKRNIYSARGVEAAKSPGILALDYENMRDANYGKSYKKDNDVLLCRSLRCASEQKEESLKQKQTVILPILDIFLILLLIPLFSDATV